MQAASLTLDLAQDLTVFEYPAFVRYSEVGHRGHMTLPAVIDAFQDCSTFQSEALGVGMAWLKHLQRGWVLSHWHIVADRYPTLCEEISVGTFASRFRGFTANRSFYVKDNSGKLIVRADSSWVFLNLETGHPCRPEPEHTAPYGMHDPLPMPAEERRVRLPEKLEPGAPVRVTGGLIDTNEHVNNRQYVQMALDQLPGDAAPREVRVDYRRAAVLGDTIYPRTAQEPDRAVTTLCDADGNPYAVVELR